MCVSVERSRSIVPEITSSTFIDSSNITKFLVGIIEVDANTRFSSTLDLSMYSPVFEHLYSEEKLGYLYSDDVRTHHAVSRDLPEEYKEIHEQYENERVAMYSAQIPVERGSVIYFDRQDKLIKYSPPQHGEVFETTSDVYSLINEGMIPMIEVHTHPTDHLFSPIDFERVLTTYPGSKRRIVNGSIVLCPDWQILAIPTFRTPYLSGDELGDRINNVEKQYALSDTRDEQLIHRKQKIDSLGEKGIYTIYQKWSNQILVDLEVQIMNGEITREQFFEIWESKYKPMCDKEIEDFQKRILRIINKFGEQYFTSLHRAGNNVNISFIRDINVKLYVSGNMKDFREFTL